MKWKWPTTMSTAASGRCGTYSVLFHEYVDEDDRGRRRRSTKWSVGFKPARGTSADSFTVFFKTLEEAVVQAEAHNRKCPR